MRIPDWEKLCAPSFDLRDCPHCLGSGEEPCAPDGTDCCECAGVGEVADDA